MDPDELMNYCGTPVARKLRAHPVRALFFRKRDLMVRSRTAEDEQPRGPEAGTAWREKDAADGTEGARNMGRELRALFIDRTLLGHSNRGDANPCRSAPKTEM